MKILMKCAMLVGLVLVANASNYAPEENYYGYSEGPYVPKAQLKGILIGEDFDSACEKLDKLRIKYEPKMTLYKKGDECSYFSPFSEARIEKDSNNKVNFIKIPISHIGYDVVPDIKGILRDYVNSDNSIVTPRMEISMTRQKLKNGIIEYKVFGTNEYNQELLITNWDISIRQLKKGNF